METIIKDKSQDFLTIKEYASITSMLEKNLLEEVDRLNENGRVILFNLTKDKYVIHRDFIRKLKIDFK